MTIRLISKRDVDRRKTVSERKLRNKYTFLRRAVIRVPKYMAPIKRGE